MFRLAEQIRSHEGGVGAAVRYHDHLAGARHHVDAHLPVYLTLGQGHIDIAGTNDLIHPGNGGGAIGQGAISVLSELW